MVQLCEMFGYLYVYVVSKFCSFVFVGSSG